MVLDEDKSPAMFQPAIVVIMERPDVTISKMCGVELTAPLHSEV